MKCVYRITVLFLAWILLFSCEVTPTPKSEKAVERINSDGTLVKITNGFSEEGCAWLVQIEEDGKQELLMPINLESKFKVEGQQLRIKFHFSKINQSDCQLGRPIVLDELILVD